MAGPGFLYVTATTNDENSLDQHHFVGDFQTNDTGSPITDLGDDRKKGRVLLFHCRTQKCTSYPSSPRRRGSRTTGSAFQAEHRFMRAPDRRHFVGDFQINAHAFAAQQSMKINGLRYKNCVIRFSDKEPVAMVPPL